MADKKSQSEENVVTDEQDEFKKRLEKLKIAYMYLKKDRVEIETRNSTLPVKVNLQALQSIDESQMLDEKKTHQETTEREQSQEKEEETNKPGNSCLQNYKCGTEKNEVLNCDEKKIPKSNDDFSMNSFIDAYHDCRNSEEREAIRKRAIKAMKKHGKKVSFATRGEFASKHALAAPYYIFFARVKDSESTHEQKLSVTFPEILDKSLGEIESSLHLNFIVDISWLLSQYLFAGQKTDMLVILGLRCDVEPDQDDETSYDDLPQNVEAIEIQPQPYGLHHSKVSIFKYTDGGIRVVISTAALCSSDWKNRTQGLWISPHLPHLPGSAFASDGESPTNFKADFEKYLRFYKEPALLDWFEVVHRTDFSAVNVFFIASVPGSHKGSELHSWGHKKLGNILSQHASLPSDAQQWPIVAQSSSIGTYGSNSNGWLRTNIIPSMSLERNKRFIQEPDFKFIYPSINDYMQSFDCKVRDFCLSYSMETHLKQLWLEDYLHRWKAEKWGRTQAMPHTKLYTRVSPNLQEIPWFILTSSNLSKSAWGVEKFALSIVNYEAGVLFIPKFVVNAETFPINTSTTLEIPVFPIPFDLPLQKYLDNDKPFVNEVLESGEI